MLKYDYLLAKIGFDTAENEPSEVWTCLPACPPPPTQSITYEPFCKHVRAINGQPNVAVCTDGGTAVDSEAYDDL